MLSQKPDIRATSRQVEKFYWCLALVFWCGMLSTCSASHLTQERERNASEHITELCPSLRYIPQLQLYLLYSKEAYLSVGTNDHRGRWNLILANGIHSVLVALGNILHSFAVLGGRKRGAYI